jgi:uncharacterized protein YeaO (DUF488 family)
MNVRLKRAYEAPAASDGARILVDRLWPRGLRKDGAKIDIWMKEIAPSTALRKWFAHDPKKWPEFATRYRGELATRAEELKLICAKARAGPVTLIYSARDEEHNQAVVLKQVLQIAASTR